MNKIETLNKIIDERRSVFPQNYTEKSIPKDIIMQILHNADRAPTHKFTEPWRFKIIKGEKRQELGKFLAEKYKAITPKHDFNEKKYKKLSENAGKADTIILICMKRDPMEQIPEWEEIASVAMAVQNMHLTCTAYDIGAYWSSPGIIKYMNEFTELEEGEKCLGFFYMGYFNKEQALSKRNPLNEKVKWI